MKHQHRHTLSVDHNAYVIRTTKSSQRNVLQSIGEEVRRWSSVNVGMLLGITVCLIKRPCVSFVLLIKDRREDG